VSEALIILGALVLLAGAGYLAACAGAERWLTLREWIGGRRNG
jgi:hypothetical protein